MTNIVQKQKAEETFEKAKRLGIDSRGNYKHMKLGKVVDGNASSVSKIHLNQNGNLFIEFIENKV